MAYTILKHVSNKSCKYYWGLRFTHNIRSGTLCTAQSVPEAESVLIYTGERIPEVFPLRTVKSVPETQSFLIYTGESIPKAVPLCVTQSVPEAVCVQPRVYLRLKVF
jgi:hypothetical protein